MSAPRPLPKFKYTEDKVLTEILEYVVSTYQGQHSHYAAPDGLQTFDFIVSAGHGESYCVANVLKYFSRLGKKDGFNRKDVLKGIHYSMMLLWLLDRKKETDATLA
jgi:hypothetical protein